MLYAEAIAAQHAGPPVAAGNQAVTPGVVYSYADVLALIANARALALSQLAAGAGPFPVPYTSHVIAALKAARDAVLRAGTQGASGYHGSELAADFAAVNSIVSKTWDENIGIYEREVANAVTLRQQVVALTVYNDFTVMGVDLFAADFRDNVVEFLDGLTDAVKAFQGYEAYAKLAGGSGLLGFIGEAVGLVVDALKGVWSIARGVVAALGSLGSLAPLVVYGGIGLAGYWGAKKVGLLGAKSS